MMIFAPLTLLNIVVALVIGKVLAIELGPSATGQYFLAMAALSLGSTLASGGLGPVMSNVFSRGVPSPNGPGTLLRVLRMALAINLSLATIVVFVLALLPNEGRWLLGEMSTSTIILVAVGVLPGAWWLVLQGALKGTRDFSAFVAVGGAFGVLNLAFTCAGALLGGAPGAVAGSVAVTVAGLLLSNRALRRVLSRTSVASSLKGSEEVGDFEKPRMLALLRPGLSALAAFAAASVGQLVVRGYLSGSLGLAAVAYFSAAFAIANRVPSLVYQTFSGYLTPTISALREDSVRIHREQELALRAGVVIATPLLLVISTGAAIVVPALLAKSFLPMVPMLRLMIVGEIISIAYWSLTSSLFPTGRTVMNVVFEWLWWILFLGGVMILSGQFALRGVGIAYVVAYALGTCALLGYEAVHTGMRPTRTVTITFASSLCILVVVPLFAEHLTSVGLLQLMIGVVASAVWTVIALGTSQPIRVRAFAILDRLRESS